MAPLGSESPIDRVLKKGGQLWLTLHPAAIPWRQALAANYRGKIFFAYVALNSLLFHFAGRQFPFLGRYESFQTAAGMRRAEPIDPPEWLTTI